MAGSAKQQVRRPITICIHQPSEGVSYTRSAKSKGKGRGDRTTRRLLLNPAASAPALAHARIGARGDSRLDDGDDDDDDEDADSDADDDSHLHVLPPGVSSRYLGRRAWIVHPPHLLADAVGASAEALGGDGEGVWRQRCFWSPPDDGAAVGEA